MKVQVQENDWTRENGKEKLWWAEDPVTKRIFFTSPMSRLPIGYVRRSTTNPREMDRLFTRMHEQERETNEKFVEKLYSQNRQVYAALRDKMRARLNSSGVSEAEKNIIRASLRLMDDKDSQMQRNNVYGISSMQESPAPLPGPTTKVTVN